MATFNVQEWRQRAEHRFQRSSAKSKEVALSRFRKELRHIRDIEVVLAWCEAKKLTVEFKRLPSMYYPDGLNIVVSSHLSTEARLHVLLHECGHHLIGTKDEHERFGRGYSDTRTRSAHHKLDVLEEEFEAWHRGLKLAARLGVKVDKESYDRTRITHLKTYVRWAAKAIRKRKRKKDALSLVGRSATDSLKGMDQFQVGAGDDRIPGAVAADLRSG